MSVLREMGANMTEEAMFAIAPPEEIADVAVFLSSPLSSNPLRHMESQWPC